MNLIINLYSIVISFHVQNTRPRAILTECLYLPQDFYNVDLKLRFSLKIKP